MNNSVLRKSMGILRKYKNIKLVITEGKKLFSSLTKLWFSENFLAMEWKKKEKQVTIKKPVNSFLPSLEISTIEIFEYWYDYAKKKKKIERERKYKTVPFAYGQLLSTN